MEGPSISVFFLLILCGEFELCFQRDFFVVGSLVGGQKKFYERFKKKYVQQLRGKWGVQFGEGFNFFFFLYTGNFSYPVTKNKNTPCILTWL